MPDKFRGTFYDVILGAEKRNRNAPKLTYTRPIGLANAVVDKFMKIFIDPDLLAIARVKNIY